MDLRDLGFDAWFAAQAETQARDGCGFARVVAVDRGAYLVRDAAREVSAELTGRLAYAIDDAAELPCVGDWVTAHFYNDDTAALILGVFPRRTFLRRRAAGEGGEVQMIAANVDTAFLVQSCHFDFNPNRLERYLIMAAEGRVEPVVVLTKTDLVGPEELERKRGLVAGVTGARVIALSNVSGEGMAELQAALAPGRTCCLLGSSGVGKTTLLNRLLGREAFDTRAVSATGEGTHSTTRRQLVILGGGAMLIDTPGMRELGLAGAGADVEAGLEAIAALAAQCRYGDCRHEGEPGCAVRAAVERGELPEERYANYLKLRKESEFATLSSLDRRRKDKAFGRFLKTVKKGLRD
jgi:ribosome biogenesis GTPase